MTAKQISKLEKMSVRELQAKFAEVVGEPTRGPNKVYLVRRIREALAAVAESRSESVSDSGESSAMAPNSGDPAFDPEVVASSVAVGARGNPRPYPIRGKSVS